ncbi:LytTR family transcriptional regulator [Paenibacillaceae bacterium]|nr:LytTR family transcriptional regulator [Paenibacillaceae bacterium]
MCLLTSQKCRKNSGRSISSSGGDTLDTHFYAIKRNKCGITAVRLAWEDVAYIGTVKKGSVYHMRDGSEYQPAVTIEEMMAVFTEFGDGFRRIDRSYIANLNAATGYDSDRDVMRFPGGHHAPVSRSCYRELEADGLFQKHYLRERSMKTYRV